MVGSIWFDSLFIQEVYKQMKNIPINWQNIQTVFLDMDGTLLDLHFDNHFWLEHMPKRYAEKNNITLEEAHADLMKNYQKYAGSLKWYCLDHWQETLQMDIVNLKHEVADRIAIRENVPEFLRFLRKINKRIVLLTNAHNKTVDLKFGYINMREYFDRIITSHDVGLAKEQAGFWEALMKIEDFEKKHSLFIDDNLDVLQTAEKFGIQNLLAIHQPDSQKNAIETGKYDAIKHYEQIMSLA